MTMKTSSVTPSTMTGSATKRRPIRRMRLDTEMLLCVSVLPPLEGGWVTWQPQSQPPFRLSDV